MAAEPTEAEVMVYLRLSDEQKTQSTLELNSRDSRNRTKRRSTNWVARLKKQQLKLEIWKQRKLTETNRSKVSIPTLLNWTKISPNWARRRKEWRITWQKQLTNCRLLKTKATNSPRRRPKLRRHLVTPSITCNVRRTRKPNSRKTNRRLRAS